MPDTGLILAIDTCGAAGSVALGRAADGSVAILGEKHLAGRTYSATLVAAVAELLKTAGIGLRQIDAIVAVSGPGSFTGVRVGLSAVKGLAEGAGIPVVAVSRLEVLASAAGTDAAALDAHRHEVYLRLAGEGAVRELLAGEGAVRELLAGSAELATLEPPRRIAVCDEFAAQRIRTAWPGAEVVMRVEPPMASDAIRLCAGRAARGEFADVARLDGDYLRRSDAEIFGQPVTAGPKSV